MRLPKRVLKPVTSFLCTVSLVSTSFAPWSAAFADEIGPTINHASPGEAIAGQPFPLEAAVTDESGVAEVRLIHRAADSGDDWTNSIMDETLPGSYVYTFGEDELTPPGLDYFIQAQDNSENKNQEQDGFEFDPYRLKVNPAALAVVSEPASPVETASVVEEKSNNNAILIGLGALAVVGIAVGISGGGGGGGGGGDGDGEEGDAGLPAADVLFR